MTKPKPTKPTGGASISADAHRAAIEATPDTRPNPLEAMIAAEIAKGHRPDTSLLRFIALVRAFPARYAHELCDIMMGADCDIGSLAQIARQCRISRQAVARHVERAKRIYRRIGGEVANKL